MNFKVPHNLVTGIGEHHEKLKMHRFGERFVPLFQIYNSHFQLTVLNNPVILFTTEYPLQVTQYF